MVVSDLCVQLGMRLSGLNPFHHFVAEKCGHRTKRRGQVSAFGYIIITKMPLNKNGSVEYCLDCIGKMAICCVWCNGPIFIGDPVVLYTLRSDLLQVTKHIAVYREDPLQVVGCLRWDCAATGADRAGFWLPDENRRGKVELIPTAYETIFPA